MTRILGAVLAGGRSRRFGSDKAVAVHEGRTLIDRAIGTLGAQVEDLVVCGRPAPIDQLTGIADFPSADLGPLGGLCAALRFARAHGFDAVLSMGCDVPMLPGDLASRLASPGGAAYFVEAPIIGLWRSALARRLETHLTRGGDRSVRRWAAAIGAEAVRAGFPIPNINTRQDLAELGHRHAS